jgi:hypothetical protein
MLIKPFKIRCSAIGEIMTNPRSKSEVLSQTTKTYCENWLKEQINGRKKQIQSKYMQKGIEVESDSINFINNFTGSNYSKNESYFENEFLTGTPDIIAPEWIIDVKNSYDFSSFPLFETEINKDYYAQLQGYMYLTGRRKAILIYTLVDMPDQMIESEAWKKARFENIDFTPELLDEVRSQYTYFDIPDELKIKQFYFEYDENFMQSVKERVLDCQIYINELLQTI